MLIDVVKISASQLNPMRNYEGKRHDDTVHFVQEVSCVCGAKN